MAKAASPQGRGVLPWTISEAAQPWGRGGGGRRKQTPLSSPPLHQEHLRYFKLLPGRCRAGCRLPHQPLACLQQGLGVTL